MSGHRAIGLALGLSVLVLAAAGAFFWKALTAMLPTGPARTPEAAAAVPAGVKILTIRPVHIPLPVSEAPRSMALAPSGSVWIAAGLEAMELNGDGTVRSRVAMPAPVSAIAFNPDGSLIAAMANRIEVRNPRGALQRSFADLDEKANVVSIAVDRRAGDLFLADAGNAVVLRYSAAGRLLGRIGSFVVPSPYFSIAVSADRTLIAANPGRHGIDTYSYEGTLLGSFRAPSMGLDGFAGCCNPACIVLLEAGGILTVEKGMARIKVFSASGDLLVVVADEKTLPTEVLGDGAVLDAGGRLLVLERSARQILAFTGAGT